MIKRETRKIDITMEKGKKNDGDKNGVGKKKDGESRRTEKERVIKR
jgi:hypothetical protein